MLSDVEEILRLSDENLRLREELKAARDDNRRSICVYCGKVQQYDDVVSWELLKEHIIQHGDECPTHPIHRAVEADELEAQLETAREALGAMKPMLRDFCRPYCQPWREGGHVSGCVDAEAALAKIGGSHEA